MLRGRLHSARVHHDDRKFRSMKFLSIFIRRLIVATLLSALAAMPVAQAGTSYTLIAEDDWFPYTAERNGVIEGFGVDVIRAAYAAVGVEVKFKATPFSRCLMQVENGDDLGCFNTVKESDTEKRFLFHKQPLYENVTGIFDMANLACQTRSHRLIWWAIVLVSHLAIPMVTF